MKNSSFNINTLKGRIAEHLIQDLFIYSGYNVFNYGLERIHPSLSKFINFNNQKASKALRFMSDFVVQGSIDGALFYLEVNLGQMESLSLTKTTRIINIRMLGL
ncbi:MAG: hypothetical protein IPO70_11605 [Bacteroidetes bacterium]|nr:hypothetical protein [Bacteroidota bacterium]MBK9672870.1 hypothetical protein [Bacteroidota bacterium]